MIAGIFIGLLTWTPFRFVLLVAGIPPLDLLKYTVWQRYGLRVLLSGDDRPSKKQLLQHLRSTKTLTNDPGQRRISDTIRLIIKDTNELERTKDHNLPPLKPPTIATPDKARKAKYF